MRRAVREAWHAVTHTKYRCIPIAYCWTQKEDNGFSKGPAALHAAIRDNRETDVNRILRNVACYRDMRPLLPKWVRHRFCPEIQLDIRASFDLAMYHNSAAFIEAAVAYGFVSSFANYGLAATDISHLGKALGCQNPRAVVAWLRHGGSWEKVSWYFVNRLSSPVVEALIERNDCRCLWRQLPIVAQLSTLSQSKTPHKDLLEDTLAAASPKDVTEWLKKNVSGAEEEHWMTIGTEAWKRGKLDFMELRAALPEMIHQDRVRRDLMSWLRDVGFPNQDHFCAFYSRARYWYSNAVSDVKDAKWDEATQQQLMADGLTIEQADQLRNVHGKTPHDVAILWKHADDVAADEQSYNKYFAWKWAGTGCSISPFYTSPSFCRLLR